MPALLPYAANVDPEATGGAMLLGVDGVCIISHGSSSARAITNAVGVAHDIGRGRPRWPHPSGNQPIGFSPGSSSITLARRLVRSRAPIDVVVVVSGKNVEEQVAAGPSNGSINTRGDVLELVRNQLAEILEIEPGEMLSPLRSPMT